MYSDTTNAECGKYDFASNNCSHLNCNKMFEEKFERYAGKIFSRFTTKDRWVYFEQHTVNNNNPFPPPLTFFLPLVTQIKPTWVFVLHQIIPGFWSSAPDHSRFLVFCTRSFQVFGLLHQIIPGFWSSAPDLFRFLFSAPAHSRFFSL
jgi:hypothetical protein